LHRFPGIRIVVEILQRTQADIELQDVASGMPTREFHAALTRTRPAQAPRRRQALRRVRGSPQASSVSSHVNFECAKVFNIYELHNLHDNQDREMPFCFLVWLSLETSSFFEASL
jgi:hypothetical protein